MDCILRLLAFVLNIEVFDQFIFDKYDALACHTIKDT